MEEKPLGQVAYEQYKARQRKGRGQNGKKLPHWNKLSDEQKVEWEAAAVHIFKLKVTQKGGPNNG